MINTVRRIPPADVQEDDVVRLYTAFNTDATVTAVEHLDGVVRLTFKGAWSVDLNPDSAVDYVWLVAR